MIRTLLIVIGVSGVLLASSATAQQPGAPREVASPLQPAPGVLPAAGFLLPLELNLAAYTALEHVHSVRLTGFPLAQNWRVDVDVQRFDVFAQDAKLVMADGEQEWEIARPDVVLLRGKVAGLEESTVFLALSPHGSNGFIRLPQQSWIISTPTQAAGAGEDAGEPRPTVIYELNGLPEGAIQWAQFQCGTDEMEARNPRLERFMQQAAMLPVRGGDPVDTLPCRRVHIAIDTDWQYTSNVFGGNTAASQAYATTLLAAVSEIYVREVNTTLEIVYLRVWSSNNTPYSATTVNDRLTEFRNHWNGNMGSVSRNIAHMLTGLRSGAGGVAYMGVLCGGSYAYGASGHINGYFPYPLQNNNGQNWDLMVVAHEIGHNFNAPHTHDTTLSPPIDGCGSGDCSLASQGTIMSYCHTCSGGMSNIRLDLHARIINERIVPYMNTVSCAASLLCPSAPGACCLPWGGCDFLEEFACAAISGATFAGSSVPCSTAGCGQAGACCLADGSCVMVTETQCATDFSGTFNGAANCVEGRCATAPVLLNHGPLLTDAGAGCSGRDVSAVQSALGNTTRGYAWTLASNSRIADEFIVPEGEEWTIDGIVLFGYDVNATSPTYTAVRIQIWDGDPRDPQSSVVAGDLGANRLTSASMMNLHRIRPGVDPMTSCTRRLQRLECAFQATLGPGTYWIDRTAGGPSSPWMAPVTYAGVSGKPHGNGLHFLQGQWSELRDATTAAPQDAPFILLGTRMSTCYANCDQSTAPPILNVDDFTCFINAFAAAQALPPQQQIEHYANCDGSTTAPVLNVDDFTCFINAFAAGCP